LAVEEQDFRVFNGEGELYLRRLSKALGEDKLKTVLFLHGAFLPSSICFDPSLEGYSWARHLALEGFDVYLLDFRGFGLSYKPHRHQPVCTVEDALADVRAAVEYILAKSKTSAVSLIGWSWGACIAGLFAGKYPHLVERIHLHAPIFERRDELAEKLEREVLRSRRDGYVGVALSELRKWLGGVEDRVLSSLISTISTGEVTYLPLGPWLSMYELFKSGEPIFSPKDIRCPVFITRGEEDLVVSRDGVVKLFRLIPISQKQLVLVQGGGHFMHLEEEKNRLKLYRLSSFFLCEDFKW